MAAFLRVASRLRNFQHFNSSYSCDWKKHSSNTRRSIQSSRRFYGEIVTAEEFTASSLKLFREFASGSGETFGAQQGSGNNTAEAASQERSCYNKEDASDLGRNDSMKNNDENQHVSGCDGGALEQVACTCVVDFGVEKGSTTTGDERIQVSAEEHELENGSKTTLDGGTILHVKECGLETGSTTASSELFINEHSSLLNAESVSFKAEMSGSETHDNIQEIKVNLSSTSMDTDKASKNEASGRRTTLPSMLSSVLSDKSRLCESELAGKRKTSLNECHNFKEALMDEGKVVLEVHSKAGTKSLDASINRQRLGLKALDDFAGLGAEEALDDFADLDVPKEAESTKSSHPAVDSPAAQRMTLEKKIYAVSNRVTTIIRISGVRPNTTEAQVLSTSRKFGVVNNIQRRGAGIFDLYFEATEPRNIDRIMRSLQGVTLDNSQWACAMLPIAKGLRDGKANLQIDRTLQKMEKGLLNAVLCFEDLASLMSLQEGMEHWRK